jgi:hypothetical protein
VNPNGWNIGGPGVGGAGFDKAKHVGHLVSFVAPTVETREGTSGPYQAAVCRYVICHECHEAWAGLGVSGTALVPRIGSAGVEIVAGELGTGEAKAGRSAPYLLNEVTPAQIEAVTADFETYGAQLPSGVTFDVEGFTAAANTDDDGNAVEPF